MTQTETLKPPMKIAMIVLMWAIVLGLAFVLFQAFPNLNIFIQIAITGILCACAGYITGQLLFRSEEKPQKEMADQKEKD